MSVSVNYEPSVQSLIFVQNGTMTPSGQVVFSGVVNGYIAV